MQFVWVILLAASLFYSMAFADPIAAKPCPTKQEMAIRYLELVGISSVVTPTFSLEDRRRDPVSFRFVISNGERVAQVTSGFNEPLGIIKGEEYPVVIRNAKEAKDFRFVDDYEFTVLIFLPTTVMRFIVGVPSIKLEIPVYLDVECWISSSQTGTLGFDSSRADMRHRCNTLNNSLEISLPNKKPVKIRATTRRKLNPFANCVEDAK